MRHTHQLVLRGIAACFNSRITWCCNETYSQVTWPYLPCHQHPEFWLVTRHKFYGKFTYLGQQWMLWIASVIVVLLAVNKCMFMSHVIWFVVRWSGVWKNKKMRWKIEGENDHFCESKGRVQFLKNVHFSVYFGSQFLKNEIEKWNQKWVKNGYCEQYQ